MLRMRKSLGGQLAYKGRGAINPVARKLRRLSIMITLLLLIIVGIAVAYIWFIGQNSEPPTAVELRTEPKKINKPNMSPTIRVGVALQFITDVVEPGGLARFDVHTNGDANCTIDVVYGIEGVGVKANDPAALGINRADEYGATSWEWIVPADAPLGNAEARVLCSNSKYSGMLAGNFTVGTPPKS